MNINFNELRKEIAGHRGAFELIVDESNLDDLKAHLSACMSSKIYPENLKLNYVTRPIWEIVSRCLTLSFFNEKFSPITIEFEDGYSLLICDPKLFGVKMQSEELGDVFSPIALECAGYAIDGLIGQLEEMIKPAKGNAG
ncbi:hypothetical protein [Thalassospira aquimaris]|uniref:DUF302 domain-containing protein n=1 Tax=Thalassospira aquimaris TaxID=3037796 RepID=A0ABT6GHA1_9PROT|nr:hypothetical protein [Thalassospira sp. FZY0004]MDG4721462.1 hypothetical protein [Thalassospira sp. FZY0004]